LVSTVVPLILLYSLVAEARYVLPEYLAITFNLVVNETTKNSRFYIVFSLLKELLPIFGMIVAFLIFCWRKKLPLNQINHNFSSAAAEREGGLNSNLPVAFPFFLLGLSGVLPIMITRVQSGYYLLTSLPFFAISLGLIIHPLVENMLERINFKSFGYKLFKSIGIALILSGIILSAYYSGRISREQNKIEDMRVITAELVENSTINILPDMYRDWSLHGYYGRYKNISLDPDLNNKHEYLLIKTSLYSDSIKIEFEKIELKTKEFELFKRR
jgi:hypothetical protein